MPEPNQNIYQLQAEINEKNAELAQKDFPEWAIIMYFYAALHWINDYAYQKNELDKFNKVEGYSQHGLRRNYVKEIAQRKNCRELYSSYNFLFNESLLARYLENDCECLDCTAKEYYGSYSDKDFKKYSDSLAVIKKRLNQKG